MNANELADELYDLDVQASQQSLNDWAEQASDMLRQQQAEIEKVNAEWVQAAMALGACVQENHSLKAEIAVLIKEQEK